MLKISAVFMTTSIFAACLINDPIGMDTNLQNSAIVANAIPVRVAGKSVKRTSTITASARARVLNHIADKRRRPGLHTG